MSARYVVRLGKVRGIGRYSSLYGAPFRNSQKDASKYTDIGLARAIVRGARKRGQFARVVALVPIEEAMRQRRHTAKALRELAAGYRMDAVSLRDESVDEDSWNAALACGYENAADASRAAAELEAM